MPQLPLIEELLTLQPPTNRVDLLRSAGFERFRSGGIIAGIERGDRVNLTAPEVELLLPAILQRTSIDDTTFARLVAETGIPLRRGSTLSEVVVSVPFASAQANQTLPITELAASSLVVWEISLRVKEVLEAIDVKEPLDPPNVSVSPGSTAFSFGGGPLLVSGIGMVIAAHAALPLGTAAMIAHWGGSLVSVLGITDLIFSWQKSSAETGKLNAETGKLNAEAGKLNAEAGKLNAEAGKLNAEALKLAAEEQKIRIEVERETSSLTVAAADSLLKAAQERLAEAEQARQNNPPRPAAALLDLNDLAAEAAAYGLARPLAAHLVNRVMPTVANVTAKYPQRLTSSPRRQAKAAGAAG